MQKNNRLATVLSLIAICLSLLVLFSYLKDKLTPTPEPVPTPVVTETPAPTETQTPPESAVSTTEAPTELPANTDNENSAQDIAEDGQYTSVEDVAAYLHLYGHLPSNYITKNEAKKLGWQSVSNDLHDVAPGMCIGGDRFMNYEGLLPEDAKYTECDVNYHGGSSRGPERIVFSDDGAIYYTSDHYESFTQLY